MLRQRIKDEVANPTQLIPVSPNAQSGLPRVPVVCLCVYGEGGAVKTEAAAPPVKVKALSVEQQAHVAVEEARPRPRHVRRRRVPVRNNGPVTQPTGLPTHLVDAGNACVCAGAPVSPAVRLCPCITEQWAVTRTQRCRQSRYSARAGSGAGVCTRGTSGGRWPCVAAPPTCAAVPAPSRRKRTTETVSPWVG
jgi:hypothetical protein